MSKGKPAVIKAFQDLTGVIDSSGLCLFVSLAEGFSVDDMVDMLEVCTGAGYTSRKCAVGRRADVEHGAVI